MALPPDSVLRVGDDAEAPDGRAERRIRIDHYVHFPEGIPIGAEVKLKLDGAITVTLEEPTPPQPVATKAALIVTDSSGGSNMPGQITVDTTNETALFEWLDDHGDTNAAAPSNASGAAVPVFTSDNTAVLTIATDAANPNLGDVTPVAEGTANVGVAPLTYPDGTPVLEADGVTPFPVPDPVPVTVIAGGAVGDALSLSI